MDNLWHVSGVVIMPKGNLLFKEKLPGYSNIKKMSLLRIANSPLNPPEKTGQALKGTFTNCLLVSTPPTQADLGGNKYFQYLLPSRVDSMIEYFKSPLKLFLIILFSITGFLVTAQDPVPVQRSENKIVLEGKVYYVHVVKAGQTVYSISRAYGLKEADIEKENPGVMSGLQVGHVIKIPVSVPVAHTLPENKDTTKFFHHALLQGETLFSLSRRYNVTLEQIEKANPGISPSNLSIGQIVFIPKPPKPTETVQETHYETHRVRRRETIYGISRMYGISEEELKRHNPELYESDLKIWQLLKIPVKVTGEPKSLVEKTDTTEVAPVDSVFTDFYEFYEELEGPDFRRRINIAYLIPFNFQKDFSDSLSDKGIDIVTPEMSGSQSSQNTGSMSRPGSIPFLEFMEGSFLALDSMKKAGASLNVKVFDTRRSPAEVRRIIASGELDRMDLIIGPFFPYNVDIAAGFSSSRRIPLIVPFHDSDTLLSVNPYVFQMLPSSFTEMEALAESVIKDPNANIVILINNDTAEKQRAEYLRKSIIKAYSRAYPFMYPVIKEIVYDAAAKTDLISEFQRTFSSDTLNTVIVPSSNEAFVSLAVTQLYFQLRQYKIGVYGLPQWSVFQNLELLYLHGLNLKYFSPYFYSYHSPVVNNFLAKWRELYVAEPESLTRRGCNYAFLGHDITRNFISAYQQYGKQFLLHTDKHQTELLMAPFIFSKNSYYSGFENRGLKLVHYNPDLSVSSEEFSFPEKIRFSEPQQESDTLLPSYGL